MGTKRPSCTLFDTLSNINTSDRKLHLGGKISRDPSPRPAMTAQSERERDSTREEDWKRDRETEKMRNKARHKDVDPRERYYERDRATAPWPREREREWRERERRQEEDRNRNGRPFSNIETETNTEVESRVKKGDTFPRMRKSSPDYGRRITGSTEMYEERGKRRQRDRPKRLETDEWEWERERERARQRERYREKEKDEIQSRAKGQGTERQPPRDEKSQQRERYQESDFGFQHRGREVGDSRDRRAKDPARKRETPRPNMEKWETRVPSPHRRRDAEIYSDSREREKAPRREGRRDTRSEGDSDERELRKERARDREREELTYQHSRSEGDNRGKTERERHAVRQGCREEDRQRHRDKDREREGDRYRRKGAERDRERYREVDRRAEREAHREGDRWKESARDSKVQLDDRREGERYRGHRRGREEKGREADPRWDETTGRGSRSLSQAAPRVPPRAQSSGEWSSDMDSEVRYRGGTDGHMKRESSRESTAESDRDAEEQRNPHRAAGRRQRAAKGSEREEREGGEVAGSLSEQRRMWLEPQRGKNSRDEFVDGERRTKGKEERRREEERTVESQAEWERGGWRVKKELDERYLDQGSYGGRQARRNECRGDIDQEETEGVSVDGEEVGGVWREIDKERKEHLSDSDGGIGGGQRWDVEGGNVTDNTEESDREEEGGSDSWARNEREGGSETAWKQDRGSMLSADSFVTTSSGGDEDEREEDEEDEFEDCQEFWEGGVAHNSPSPVALRGAEADRDREEDWTVGKEEVVDEDEPGTEKQPKYVFCVIGQTLPRTNTVTMSPSQANETEGVGKNNRRDCCNDDAMKQPQDDLHLTLSRNDKCPIIDNKDTESKNEVTGEEQVAMREKTKMDLRYKVSSEHQNTETGEGTRSKLEHPYAEIKQIKRDSQTERLLIEWREKSHEGMEAQRGEVSPVPSNPYADDYSQVSFEQIQPILDVINTGTMSPEEVEAIRIRMSGAWSMSDESKRHSQAPHLKWAKNVVREILGRSEEQTADELNAEVHGDQGVNQSETALQTDKRQEVAQGTGGMPVVTLTTDEQQSEPEVEEEEEELLEVEGLRGMGQSQADMHADQFAVMHGDAPTYTRADTLLNTKGKEDHSMDKETEPSGHLQLDKADVEVKVIREARCEAELSEMEKEASREKEVEMYLSVSNTLYKPNSCPILNYESQPDLLVACREGEGQEVEHRKSESEDEKQGEVPEERGTVVGVGQRSETDGREGEVVAERKLGGGTVTSSCSLRDMGPEVRLRRRGIRKTSERKDEVLVQVEEEEGVGRDRRTRIFSTTDDEDDRSKSWGEVELRNVLETIDKRKRNSRFFNAAQLYQQYSEAAQNFEILRQARSDAISVCEDPTPSPAPSPPPARRPLPPLPSVPHPHSLSHTGSITSVKSLPLPEPPKSEGRPSSPRLSICLSQSATLWRELPGVRNSSGLEELTEDQRRLQEVRFEVVTSEASYCRSLDIVVEHFVKSKQLGALLTTQDRNWLFSRLADVRAISHSFLSKLEERVESDIMYFTVCDIIARHCQRFKMVYVPYLTNQSYQDTTYQRLMNENQGFKRIVEKLERSPVCQRLPLRSFLVLPFQRITRIKLLVQNIVKRTTPGTAEATQAIKSLKLLEKLIQESNDSITQMKSIESLVSLSAKVDFECRTLPLISQSRRLVREGPVTELMDFSLKDTERNIYLHLFNDYLLLSLQKEGGRFTVIDHSPVSDLRAENCRVKLHSLQKNLFRLHMSHKALLLRTDTQGDKLRWISALSRPHSEIDFSAAQDFPQMQCIRAFVAQQPDELSLEKADIILVHQQSSDHWVEGTRLSDRHRGWVPESHLETISNSRVRQRNLSDALKLTTATAAV